MNSANKLIFLSKALARNNFLCRRWLHSSLISCKKQEQPEILLDGEQTSVLRTFLCTLLQCQEVSLLICVIFAQTDGCSFSFV